MKSCCSRGRCEMLEWTGDPLLYPRSKGAWGMVIGRSHYLFDAKGGLVETGTITFGTHTDREHTILYTVSGMNIVNLEISHLHRQDCRRSRQLVVAFHVWLRHWWLGSFRRLHWSHHCRWCQQRLPRIWFGLWSHLEEINVLQNKLTIL